MPYAWRPFLLTHSHDGIPPLLIKYHFGSSDYKVWLTDLTYIWTESLDRRQILRKALDVDTSIDPSEDSAQLRLFLRSIADALRQHPGTNATFDRSNNINQLALNTLTPLPHPLRPLEWSIVLKLAPQYEFASKFVSPLLSQQLTAKVEKISLLQHLREKDNVISKLTEKMQGDGVDLGKVFPGAVLSKSAAGHTAPGAVAKSIKGLQEFNQVRWEAQIAKKNEVSRDTCSLLPEIFDDDEKANCEGLQIADFGEWWKKVAIRVLKRDEATPASVEIDARKDHVVEDEFQRQSTPTKFSTKTSERQGLVGNTELRSSENLGEKSPDENGSTTDESDDNLQPSRSKTLSPGEDEASAGSPESNIKCMQSEQMDLDDESLSTSTSDIDNSPAKIYPILKSRKKLGKIGGKGKECSPDAPAIPTSKPKLGMIGGKGKGGGVGLVSIQNESFAWKNQEDIVSSKQEVTDPLAAPTSMEPVRRGRTAEQPPEPSPPRETSQERADRKRAQLKRELENKSHAAVKKKRRF